MASSALDAGSSWAASSLLASSNAFSGLPKARSQSAMTATRPGPPAIRRAARNSVSASVHWPAIYATTPTVSRTTAIRPPWERAARACSQAAAGSSSVNATAAAKWPATNSEPSFDRPRRSANASRPRSLGSAHSGISGQVKPSSALRLREPLRPSRSALLRRSPRRLAESS